MTSVARRLARLQSPKSKPVKNTGVHTAPFRSKGNPMPWQGKDAKKHTKAARSAADQKLWSAVANQVLHQSGRDSKAIKIANAKLKNRKAR